MFRISSRSVSFVWRFLVIAAISFVAVLHFFLPRQDAELPIDGFNLLTKGILPGGILGNKEPSLQPVMNGRFSQPKFILPLIEKYYPKDYKKIITLDFASHLPLYLIFNKNTHRQAAPNKFFTQAIMNRVEKYQLIFENEYFKAYKRI